MSGVFLKENNHAGRCINWELADWGLISESLLGPFES